MNVDYINAFYKAISEVLKRMLDLDVKMGKAELNNELGSEGRTGILLNLVGDLEGYAFFTFPDKTAINMVNSMSGLGMKTVDEFVHSALSEIVNIISGNAVTLIADTGNICDISPPEVYLDEFKNIMDRGNHPLRLPIINELGEFDVYLYIMERN